MAKTTKNRLQSYELNLEIKSIILNFEMRSLLHKKMSHHLHSAIFGNKDLYKARP